MIKPHFVQSTPSTGGTSICDCDQNAI